MQDTNRIFISGDVVADAQLTRDGHGQAVYFQIVSTRLYRDGNAWKTKECLIEVEAYDRLAVQYAPVLKKGQKVSVEGFLKEIELERRITYAINATSLMLVEVPPSPYETAKGSAPASSASSSTAPAEQRRPADKGRGENDIMQRLTAEVGEPPADGAPFVEEEG